jgi:hypothetical protein
MPSALMHMGWPDGIRVEDTESRQDGAGKEKRCAKVAREAGEGEMKGLNYSNSVRSASVQGGG